MQSIKLDMNKFIAAQFFKSKSGVDHIAIPLDANNMYRGDKGLYCSLTLHDKPNEYGDDGFATVDLGKDRRMAGEKGPILGNWRHIGERQPARSPNQNGAKPPLSAMDDSLDESDTIPF